MKNLLILSNTSTDLASKYIEYIKLSNLELEIITVDDYENSYQNLDKAIYIKQNKQLFNLTEYRYCFFLNNKEEDISLPSTFIKPQLKNIILFNPIEFPQWEESITIPSIKFWYSNSLDFDAIGKFYKSNILNTKRYYTQNTKELKVQGNESLFFLFWLNQINIFTNFIK